MSSNEQLMGVYRVIEFSRSSRERVSSGSPNFVIVGLMLITRIEVKSFWLL